MSFVHFQDNKMKAFWTKRTLNFKQPAGTSRGVMKYRDVWVITLSQDGITGIGECAPLPGLSLDNITQIENKLDEVCENPELFLYSLTKLKKFPSIRFGLEISLLDLKNGGGQIYFQSLFTTRQSPISINGLIWMGDLESMMKQVEQKLAEGWKCIKLKIGALDFEKELEILKSIRNRFGVNDLELRVDANGAFNENDVKEKLEQLAQFGLHSIEQPIQPGQWNLMSELCKMSLIPIALDEELIPLVEAKGRIEMLDKVKPQYIVPKPSMLGGFTESEKWIKLAKSRNIGWWITSALESNIGLNAIAQWTAKMEPNGFQGLGTGQLFTNNIPSPLKVKSGKLAIDKTPIWEEVNQFISEWYSPNDEMMLQTSGSSGKPKSISVKKEWMKNSARLTGNTFGLNEDDTALLCMPIKFIAGKMMVVRSLELGLDLKVVKPSSNPLDRIDAQIDFTAMVPLQLKKSIDQLDKVKTLIVGGGQVSRQLVDQVQPVSTQVCETYGMTETLTHVAIRPLNGPDKSDAFQALDGVHFEMDDRNCLVIHAPMLNPNSIVTNDLVDLISEKSFRWLGRYDNVINSGGVKIIPEVVEAKLVQTFSDRRFFIAGLPDESLGEKVVLVVEGDEINISLDVLDKFEKPKGIYFLPEFVETESGKVNRNETLTLID